MPEDAPGDFRYETGEANVPWAAVGEHLAHDDLMKIVRFLARPVGEKADEYDAQLSKVEAALESLWDYSKPATKLSLGDTVKKLEAEARDFLGCQYAVFLTNATAGFEIALRYADIGPGDEVIIPGITFIATMTYTLQSGAKAVFADVDPNTVNIDPEDVARKITPNTKAIIPVYIGGYPPDMDAIMELAEDNDITVLSDAAHAFGGEYKGKAAGTVAHFGAYSFHEVKNINALGEGGLLVTDLEFGEYFPQARFLGVDMSTQVANWLYDVKAIPGKYGPVVPGNHSSTEIQALCLLGQMARLQTVIDHRRKNAEYLNERFADVEGLITPPLDTDEIKSTHHLYLLRVDHDVIGQDVQVFKEKLQKRGVTNIPHFAPLYHFQICRDLGYDTDAIAETCPNTEMVFNHQFTHLPLYPLTQEQLEYMAGAVIDAVEEMKEGK
ncbi:MAG: DegT/DnrJ/EryC1/StrS family aminotransferase [Armatimonadota bacterium]